MTGQERLCEPRQSVADELHVAAARFVVRESTSDDLVNEATQALVRGIGVLS